MAIIGKVVGGDGLPVEGMSGLLVARSATVLMTDADIKNWTGTGFASPLEIVAPVSGLMQLLLIASFSVHFLEPYSNIGPAGDDAKAWFVSSDGRKLITTYPDLETILPDAGVGVELNRLLAIPALSAISSLEPPAGGIFLKTYNGGGGGPDPDLGPVTGGDPANTMRVTVFYVEARVYV